MPLDEGVRRARLALQEGAASLHAVLHHLQGVLIGCRADRQIHRQIKTNLSRQPKTVITLNSLQPKPQLWQILIPHSNYQRGAGTQWLRPTQHWRRVLSTERWLRYALSFLKPLSGRQTAASSGGRRDVVSPLELNPRHWRMGFPYLTSCRRLRLKGSDQCCQIRREKNHKATASHPKPFDRKHTNNCGAVNAKI